MVLGVALLTAPPVHVHVSILEMWTLSVKISLKGIAVQREREREGTNN